MRVTRCIRSWSKRSNSSVGSCGESAKVGSQGINSYAYVRNNPLRLIDPNGLDAIDLNDVEPLDLYAAGDWGDDPGPTLAADGSLNDASPTTDDIVEPELSAAADDPPTPKSGGNRTSATGEPYVSAR